jgi:hypothetical protein
MGKKTALLNNDQLANTQKMLLVNELTNQLGRRVMGQAKDLQWNVNEAFNRVVLKLTRKLDNKSVAFYVDREGIEAAGGPYITLPEETKAMLVLFLQP